MPLTVTLNGHTRCFPHLKDSTFLSELLAELGLKPDRVAVEKNGDIVARRNWENLCVQEGDKLEIVHFVGGGSSDPSPEGAAM